ncbi:MAG: hypothetical protein LBM73_02275, partial [Candidatus Nomurabacteria bacterium]|nr:hypothetical protein [Candidatus Nomurabacteria bacterium]
PAPGCQTPPPPETPAPPRPIPLPNPRGGGGMVSVCQVCESALQVNYLTKWRSKWTKTIIR